MQDEVLVGAYALTASLAGLDRSLTLQWLGALQDLTGVRGLELPVAIDPQPMDLATLIPLLPKTWDYVLTLLPGTMQNLARNPRYGLASTCTDGRAAALSFTEFARQYVARINEHCGRRAVIAVEVHSAPTRGGAVGVGSDLESLRVSLAQLKEQSWYGAELVLEHCDAYTAGRKAAKGFLDFAEELGLLEELQLGLSLNWGRSVLESRSSAGIFAHIEQAQRSGRLRGFIFSGVAQQDALYGDWEDNHAPIVLPGRQPWTLRSGLLDPAVLSQTLRALRRQPPDWVAIKVQPFPTHLTLADRLAFFREQWAALQTAITGSQLEAKV